MKSKLLRNCLAFAVVFMVSLSISAQTQEPVDMVLIKNAPNLRWIQRTAATQNVFKGDKFNYRKDENVQLLNHWIVTHPQEFEAYKKALDEFFRTKKVGDFIPSERDYYYDLKAQYQLLKNIKPW